MRVLATGGYFDDSAECFVDRIDLARGTRERLLSFVPLEPHRVPGKGFTGGAWVDDDTLLVCSFDAVWRFRVSTGQATGRLHQPDFNDLHDVAVGIGRRGLRGRHGQRGDGGSDGPRIRRAGRAAPGRVALPEEPG